jgi:hypothetical protein
MHDTVDTKIPFNEYLYGSKFEVKTDNNPFTYIFDKAKLDVVGHRWVASLLASVCKMNGNV